jgi:MYXO-CTERM domain-containing protein
MTTVSGTAAPGATVNVMRDGVIVGTATAGSDGSYSIGVNLVPGPNDLSVSQSVNGQSSALSDVIYNQTPSAPSLVLPATATSAQKASAFTATGMAVPSSIVLLLDNGIVIGSTTATADGSYSMPVWLSSGANALTATSSVEGIPGASSQPLSIRVDFDPPFFPAPPVDILAYAPTSKGAAASWPTITAYDAQDGKRSAACDHAPGSMFPLGTTTVTCESSDTLGNSATSTFSVNVVLQNVPTLTLPPGKEIVVKSALETGANVSFDVTALDGEGKPIAAVCTPASGSFFEMGTTKVSCTATDTVEMTATSASFDVTVKSAPYYYYLGDVRSDGSAEPKASSGCNMAGTSGAPDFSALAAVGLAIAAARRRKASRAKHK